MKPVKNNGGVSYGKKEFTKNSKVAYRQYNALYRLELQKDSGKKIEKGKKEESKMIPLNMKDYQRIDNEINSLRYKLSENFSHLLHELDSELAHKLDHDMAKQY